MARMAIKPTSCGMSWNTFLVVMAIARRISSYQYAHDFEAPKLFRAY
jgi:hypothetical protein